tara:strand:+ start:814 stop:1020 length:207 start_codon:yes stop_codon:yes gene_type:complete
MLPAIDRVPRPDGANGTQAGSRRLGLFQTGPFFSGDRPAHRPTHRLMPQPPINILRTDTNWSGVADGA